MRRITRVPREAVGGKALTPIDGFGVDWKNDVGMNGTGDEKNLDSVLGLLEVVIDGKEICNVTKPEQPPPQLSFTLKGATICRSTHCELS